MLGGDTANDISLRAGSSPRIRCYGEIGAITYTNISKESAKENIEKYTETATEIIKASDIYRYNFKREKDKHKKHIGFVIGDLGGNYKTPKEVISSSGEGIDSYTMTSILWKAVQELNEKVEKLEEKIREEDLDA